MKAYAIILARGGSKGIPGKNLAEVGGVPLVARSAKSCVEAGFPKTFVYSDSDEILECVISHVRERRLFLVKRPPEISQDETSSEETICRFLKDHSFDEGDVLALVQPTTPFLSSDDLRSVIRKFKTDESLETVLTATDIGTRFLGYSGHEHWRGFIPTRPYRSLRQQATTGRFWMENGGCYATKIRLWKESRRIGHRSAVVEMDWWRSIEIDEPEDLLIARAIAPVLEGP